MNYINPESIKLDNLIYNDNSNIYQSKLLYDKNNLDTIQINSGPLKICDLYNKNGTNYIDFEFLPSNQKLYEFITRIDEAIINDLYNRSQHLLGFKLNFDTIVNMYQKTISLPKNIPSLPLLTCILSNNCKFEDVNGELLNYENLKKNNEVSVSLKFDIIEFYKNKYKLSIETSHIKINNYVSQSMHSFFDDCESENSESNIITEIMENV